MCLWELNAWRQQIEGGSRLLWIPTWGRATVELGTTTAGQRHFEPEHWAGARGAGAWGRLGAAGGCSWGQHGLCATPALLSSVKQFPLAIDCPIVASPYR